MTALTAFAVSGTRNNRHVTVVWIDGDVHGDLHTVIAIRRITRALDDPQRARSIIESVFPGPTTFTPASSHA